MTQDQRDEIEHFEHLAATYRTRLRVLERQIAEFGSHVPAHLILDKERTERGLARALTGDTAGAIEDFKAYIAWAKQNSFDVRRIL